MTAILGVSAFYHDSAAALIVDGEIVAAAAEERFTRRKHDAAFPQQAIHYCLQRADFRPEQVDFVGFYEKPLLKFDRLLETYLAFAPLGYRSFRQAMPSWLTTKLRLPRIIGRGLNHSYRKRIVFCAHHQSHAASAFFPSPFDEAAILTVDGVGEWATATVGIGQGKQIKIKHELCFPHSLGLLYSAFTAFCGFRVNDGEYKLMGLAPHGDPVYRDLILEELIDLKPDGSFRLDMRYFNYCQGLTMTSARLARLLDLPPRRPDGEIAQQYMDLAASVQAVCEEILIRIAEHVQRVTGMPNLVMAGGVALNCVANGRIQREGPFEQMWIQPAAGDDGGAFGVALLIWHQLLGNERTPQPADSQRGSLLGPSFDDAEIRKLLDEERVDYETATDEQQLCDLTAELLAEGKVVGWFQDRMEYGPRALGSRSILADPRDSEMQSRLNATVKNRESFRPFAPAVLAEKAEQFFQIEANQPLPYMLFAAPCTATCELPAIAHVDGSSRLQTVDRERFPKFHRLLESFDRLTGCPVLVNTSFNVRSEPIVCTPRDAYRCFLNTDLDVLAIGSYIVRKRADHHNPKRKRSVREPQNRVKRQRIINLEIPWRPTPQQLWRFVGSLVIALPLIAMLFRLKWEIVVGVTVPALLLAVATKISPAPAQLLYRLMLAITLPLMLIVSEVLLAAIYLFVLTPIGFALRVAGRSSLALRIERKASTYWQDSPSPREAIDYYRQS